MKQKIRIDSQIDFLFEAFQVLTWLATNKVSGNTFTDFKKTILQKNRANSEHVRKCIALDEKIWSRVSEHYENEMEQIRALFGEIENQIIPADLVLCSNNLMPTDLSGCESIEELCRKYEQLTAKEKDTYFFYKLTCNVEKDSFEQDMQEKNRKMSDAERVCSIFSYIQSMEVGQESKLRIQEVYLKRDLYFQQVTKIIQETIAILKEYEEDMQQLVQEWEEYWKKIVEEGSFLDKIKGLLDVDDSLMKNGFCVMPSLIQSAALWLNVENPFISTKKKYMSTCRVGMMYTEQFDLNDIIKENFDMDEMLLVMKALVDKSKMDILLYIKDKPAYGSEIAKHFSLTTATVSYHMNKMLQLRIVQAELRDGKVYYQTRKEVLQELFEKARKLFR